MPQPRGRPADRPAPHRVAPAARPAGNPALGTLLRVHRTPPARSTAWLWLLVACAVLTQSTVNLLRPVTSYKLLALHADAATIGLCTAAYAVVPLVAAVWLGRVSDRIRQLRLLVLAGAALIAGGGALLALAGSIWAIVGASAVLGMGHLCFTIGGQASIARYAADRDLDKGFGWFTAAFSAGQMAGPILGGALVGSGAVAGSPERLAQIDLALWVGAGLSVLVLPLMARRPASRPTPPATAAAAGPSGNGADAGRPTVLRILGTPGVKSPMLAALALLAMIDILTAFLPLVGERAGVGAVAIGALLGVRGCASIASRLLLPWFVTRFSRAALLTVCLLGAGSTLLIPPLVTDRFLVAALSLAVGGFLLGMGQPITMALISTAVPDAWRGSALAVRLMGNRLGQVVMPLVAGAIAAPLGPAGAVWLACAVLLLSGAQTGVRRSMSRT